MKDISSVIIFRKKLLPYSETFIAAQSEFLLRYNPVYSGFNNDLAGKGMLIDSACYVLEDYVNSIVFSKFLFRMGLPNSKWLKSMSSHAPSLIHAHFLQGGLDALQLKKSLSIPMLTTLHGHDVSKKEKKSFLKKDRKYFFKHVDKVIVVSDYIKNCAIENGCPEEKIIKHSIGIDIGKFTQEKREAECPEILFVGRLVEKKGCIYLLQAMSLLKKNYPELKLVIIGEGGLYKELKEYVEQERLNVEFVGRKSPVEIREKLSTAWVFVAPSITAASGDAEGLGMVFLEAQALKTPVITFNSGGVGEAIEDGVTGFLKEEKDVAGLVEKIEFFIECEQARRKFGKKGRQLVESKFDIKKQSILLESIYDRVRYK